jgi:hypothetical protein
VPGRIELRVRDLRQIFNSMDPSPFHDQDLAVDAEEYIVDSLKELPGRHASEIVVHLEQSATESDATQLEAAVHAHFTRRALHLRRSVRDLLSEGAVSLAIGVTILVLFFVLGRLVVRAAGENPWTTLARESLLIGGWVAMWRPMEIFLYRWWPIVGERRLHERLATLPVRLIVDRSDAASGDR